MKKMIKGLKDKMKKLVKSILEIIPLIFVHPGDKQLLEQCEWIDKLSKLYYICIRIYPRYRLYCFFKKYLDRINKAIMNKKVSQEQVIKHWMEHFEKSSDKIKFFETKLFFESGFITDEVSKMIMDYAYNTPSPNRRNNTVMDISMQTFRWAKGYYPDFYNDRKKILKKISDESCIVPNKTNRKDNKKRLCIVTYMLAPDFFNSVQRVASMITKNLHEYYDEILVASIETFHENKEEEKDTFFCYRKDYSRQYMSKINALFPDNVTAYIPDNLDYKGRSQQVLDQIYQFDPNVIIDMSDEMSAISYIYGNDYPVYYIPMRSNASSVNFTYILGRIWKYDEGNKIFNSIDIKRVKEWMFPEYVPERAKDYSKKDIGVKEDSFIIVSIGKNDTTYSNHFLDLMCKFLDENPKIAWLLVGNGASSYIKEKYSNLLSSKRIIEWGFEKNLTGLCAACDAHIRPNMTGGSGATAIACQNGLPVVMTDFVCDPMRWLGRNYSSLHTEEDMITELKKLYMDSTYYNLQRERVLQLVSKATNSKYWWNKLFEILSTTGSVEE